MHWQQQGPQECMLATVAMLRGLPLADVRRLACEAAGVDAWAELWRLPDWESCERFWHGVAAVTTEDLLESLYTNAPLRAGGPRELPPRGRGHVSFYGGDDGHVCPWEDGRLLDPEGSGELETLAEYLQRCPWWDRHQVVVVDEGDSE